MFDVAVIGGGIMGAPTARILSEQGFRVALIASREPEDPAHHRGPFGAHYDVSRLTWLLHSDPLETGLSLRSQRALQVLERRFGGILSAPGYLYAAAPGRDEGSLEAARRNPDIDLLDAGGLARQYPLLRFPDNVVGFGEAGPSGVMNPRAVVAAEQRLAVEAGAQVIAIDAVGVEVGTEVTVGLSDGRSVRARKAVVAAGGFSNRPGLLPRPVALRLKQETVLLAELDEAEARRLAEHPTLIYQADLSEIGDIYSTPPARYPDGRTYLKWGCNTIADRWIEKYEDIGKWYRRGNSDSQIDLIRPHVERVIPGLRASSWVTQRCVIAYTAHGKPYIDELVADRLYVAVGGNGHSAKWSFALGELAAALVTTGEWGGALPRGPFRVRYMDEVKSWHSRELWRERSSR